MVNEKYVTIMAINRTNNEACIVDQVEYATSYIRVWGNTGPNPPLVGHYSCMRSQWPPWNIISKESWEQKYGKIDYP